MLRNYVTIALRNIRRHKGHTLINVTGLAVGMATCILIMLWVADELSFDRFHQDADHIYRIYHELTMGGETRRAPRGSNPMAPAIQAGCPEVAAITRLRPGGRTAVEYGKELFFEDNILYADSQFFDVFTFPLIAGDDRTALARSYSVVITREIARKYFGDIDPLGKILRFDGSAEYTVTGVIDKVPLNSHISFDLLCSLRTLVPEESTDPRQWGTLGTYTYLRVANQAGVEDLEKKISSIIDEHLGARLKQRGILFQVRLQPLMDIHLHSDFEGDIGTRPGNMAYILLFTGIALGVLLIACANFINLTTAGSAYRVKEIGVRKTFGADHGRLTFQLLIESILLSLAALVLAMIMIEIALPSFNTMTERDLSLPYFAHAWIIPGFFLFTIFVGVVAGIYPALSLSSMKTVAALRSINSPVDSSSILRRVLVVGQYAISIALIIGTATIYDQVNFMKNKSLGFAENQLLIVRGVDNLPAGSAATLKKEIGRTAGVIQASLSSAVPGAEAFSMQNVHPEGANQEDILMLVTYADESSMPTLGLELAAGRNFSREMGSDSLDATIINEAAVRKLGWEDAIGKTIDLRISTPEGPDWKPRKVIGVVKDFHYTNLRRPVEPLIIVSQWSSDLPPIAYLSIRIETTAISHTLDMIRERWELLSGGAPFDYFFVDQQFAEQYRTEERLGKIAISFSLLAVFVACLGLFGMASHMARRRTKEIGIRKVLGATTRGIAALLTTELVKWVLIANVIAWPIAYYIMNRWLQTFAYRTSISPIIFILSGTLALVVAVATVGYQAVHAARANPVDSLKYE